MEIIIVIGVAVFALFVVRSSYKGDVELVSYERRKVEERLSSLANKLTTAENRSSFLEGENSSYKQVLDARATEISTLKNDLVIANRQGAEVLRITTENKQLMDE